MEAQTFENPRSVLQSAPLIASDRVEGTAVYRSDGYRIGTIKRLMIEKKRGKVAYAILTFGGILGFGEDYYPVPWGLLSYNESLGGYELDISDAELKNVPQFCDENWDNGDRNKESALFDYYGVGSYW